MKDFKFTEEERDDIAEGFCDVGDKSLDDIFDRIEAIIQARADAEQTTPKLVLTSEEKKYTRFELERAHMAGWNNIDFEDWIKNLNPHINE